MVLDGEIYPAFKDSLLTISVHLPKDNFNRCKICLSQRLKMYIVSIDFSWKYSFRIDNENEESKYNKSWNSCCGNQFQKKPALHFMWVIMNYCCGVTPLYLNEQNLKVFSHSYVSC